MENNEQMKNRFVNDIKAKWYVGAYMFQKRDEDIYRC